MVGLGGAGGSKTKRGDLPWRPIDCAILLNYINMIGK